MIYVALNATPSSSPFVIKQLYALATFLVISDKSGKSSSPIPPSSSGVIVHYLCTNFESTEHPSNSHPSLLNYGAALLNALISVGHTNVKSKG